jgi:adenylylsulfate kinase
MSGFGVVVWFTGLPASGKSTLAARVRSQLVTPSILLDSDVMREVFEAESYTTTDRDRFYRVLANLAATLARQGLVVMVAATARCRAHRELARKIAPRFVEVWVRTQVAECARRDVKGLYVRAEAGELPTFPGVGVPYEPPTSPDVIAEGGFDDTALAAIRQLVR